MSGVTKIIPLNATDKVSIFVPEDFPLSSASFDANGDDLVVTAPDGTQLLIEDYFISDNPPNLNRFGGGDSEFDPLSGIIGGSPIIAFKSMLEDPPFDATIEGTHESVEDLADTIFDKSEGYSIDGVAGDDFLFLTEGRDYLIGNVDDDMASNSDESPDFNVYIQLVEKDSPVHLSVEDMTVSKANDNIISAGRGNDVISGDC